MHILSNYCFWIIHLSSWITSFLHTNSWNFFSQLRCTWKSEQDGAFAYSHTCQVGSHAWSDNFLCKIIAFDLIIFFSRKFRKRDPQEKEFQERKREEKKTKSHTQNGTHLAHECQGGEDVPCRAHLNCKKFIPLVFRKFKFQKGILLWKEVKTWKARKESCTTFLEDV